MKIKTKLTSFLTLIEILFIAGIVIFLTVNARTNLVSSAENSMKISAKSIASQVARLDEIIVRVTESITANPGVRKMDPEEHAQAIAGGFSALSTYAYTMYSIDADGTQFILKNGERGTGYRGDRFYFTEAMKNKVARQILMGRSLDPPAPAVAYGVPILSPDGSGNVQGVMLVAAELSELFTE